MIFNIEKFAEKAIEILEKRGFEGYVVGGCVRDLLMGKAPHDWDICTNANPQEIVSIFSEYKVIETGVKHGTVTVIIDRISLEITTFRIDGEYSDNRRPDGVKFVSDIKEDLARRDFTINAMAYSNKTGLIDCFGGQADLGEKLIKCVGNPDTRFHEDALRVLRALRFSSQLSFEIEKETFDSILKNKELLKNISAERIASELNKLLLGDNVFEVLQKYREVIAVFIPEFTACFDFKQFTKHHCYSVYDHIIKSVECVEKDLILRLTMFFHDIAKPQCFVEDKIDGGNFKGHQLPSAEMAEKVLKRLKYDNETIHSVVLLIKEHDNRYPAERKVIKSYLRKFSKEFFENQLKVRRADTLAQSLYMREEKIAQLDSILAIGADIIKENECFKLEDLAVKGKDLIAIGIPQGEKLGRVLNQLLSLVISGELKNEKEILLSYSEKLK